MSLLKRDNNELRYNAIFLINKQGNPDYYKTLFRNAKAFFIGMGRMDLKEQLETFIKDNVEKKIGREIDDILMVYKNLPYLNSFTRSHVPGVEAKNIYKQEITRWLDQVETYIFSKAFELESEIIFSMRPEQHSNY
jgi:hypothetical protein